MKQREPTWNRSCCCQCQHASSFLTILARCCTDTVLVSLVEHLRCLGLQVSSLNMLKVSIHADVCCDVIVFGWTAHVGLLVPHGTPGPRSGWRFGGFVCAGPSKIQTESVWLSLDDYEWYMNDLQWSDFAPYGCQVWPKHRVMDSHWNRLGSFGFINST